MSQRFNIINTPLIGTYLIHRKKIGDSRGFLSRFFCREEFESIGFKKSIYQINHTFTNKKGSVRGLHFQYPPYAETKIVSCISGEIFDVAVDLRKNSPTFLQWYGVVLSKENQTSFLIPEGFAHGFQALTNCCELIYLHTAPYVKNFESGLNILDPVIDIKWPLPIRDLSERDKKHNFIDHNYEGIDL